MLARARQDLDGIVAYVAGRSPEGAAHLLAGYDDALATLERKPFVAPIAPASREFQEEVRHVLFRTMRILRMRGAGQTPVARDDLEI